jgi:leader peptidase (prepilin peptidase) / N-methyltransferase
VPAVASLPLPASIAVAAVAGLFVGSFLNVVAYRTPRELSVAAPRSFCPTCRRQLAWWENVPVLSWLALRGRCRTCHAAISSRYPLVETATAASFALVTWTLHGTLVSVGYCLLAAGFIAVALVEYDGFRAPLRLAAIGTTSGLAFVVIGAGLHGRAAVAVGAAVGSAVAALAYGILRHVDPASTDPRAHGRSTLLLAGCWLGGLGAGPAVAGALAWLAVYFVAMVVVSVRTRHPAGADDNVTTRPPRVPVLARVPLVTAITAALLASLVAK